MNLVKGSDIRPGSSATEYVDHLAELLRLVPKKPLELTVALLLNARRLGGRVYIMGNGGSAATASHMVCDLVKTAHVPGKRPLRAYALADNAALLTAVANDATYERTFADQIDGVVEASDVVIAISASGNSPNVAAGLRAAAARGAHTVALVGFDGGAAGQLADITIHVPSHEYGPVEDAHSAIGHALTSAIRHALMVDGDA
jgi:D-sedoheptulose 7-phosphate isomerase